jgi:RNA polymerase sigma-70 factor (ECF subfamily)
VDTWKTTTILLERLQDADDAAWNEFSARFRDPITRFARKLGLPEDAADDLAQETLTAFLRAHREGRYDRTRARLRSWLFGIAHKEALRLRRDLARRPRQGPDALDQTTFFSALPDEGSLQRTWDDQWDRHTLERCLDRARVEFEPSTFEAFELAALREVPPAEVADRLRISRNSVYIAKHRVLSRLAQLQSEFESVA